MSTLRANTVLAADGTTTTPVSIPSLDARMARAWVNFTGVGATNIRKSFNVTSITDNGVGDYTANFTTPMPDANFSVVLGVGQGAGAAYFTMNTHLATPNTANHRFLTGGLSGGTGVTVDAPYVSLAIFD